MIEVRTCVEINMWCQYVGYDFMWLVKCRDWYSGVRAIGPEYGRLYRFGLINYVRVYYACKLRGLSAFSRERDSLLRCVGGDGEAGAFYVNKWFNCNPKLFLDSLPECPLHIWVLWNCWPWSNNPESASDHIDQWLKECLTGMFAINMAKLENTLNI